MPQNVRLSIKNLRLSFKKFEQIFNLRFIEEKLSSARFCIFRFSRLFKDSKGGNLGFLNIPVQLKLSGPKIYWTFKPGLKARITSLTLLLSALCVHNKVIMFWVRSSAKHNSLVLLLCQQGLHAFRLSPQMKGIQLENFLLSEKRTNN